MATSQAFCNICQSKVSTDTLLTDDALRQALERDEDISVMHVFVDEDASSADHIWSLSSQEKENLRKYLSSGQR
jgi:N-acetylglutamate synthase/N-acetylornithine aminotransferase